MKTLPVLCLLLSLLLAPAGLCSCGSPGKELDPPAGGEQTGGTVPDEKNDDEETMNRKITLKIGETAFAVTLAENASAAAFFERLPMTLAMSELNGNEKYHYLSESLPADASVPGKIETGDLMLYGDSCVVLFYKSFSSGYSYTRLGRVDDPAGLAAALGSGSVTVAFGK